METTLNVKARDRWAVLILLAAFSLFGVFDHSLWSANDTREGAMIAEMVRSGAWTLPHLNGVPYLEKPPLLHWTGAVLCRMFGAINEGLVRLPAALYGFGSLLLIWQFGRALGRERAGLIAALLCATTQLMADYSRIVLTDTALTFTVLLALWLFWRAYTATTGRKVRFVVFLAVAAGSFYAKGLIGPGFIWVSVGLFLLWQRAWRLLFGLPLLFLPIFALELAPWVAALWREGGAEYLVGVFWDNQFGRFLSFSDPTLPRDPYFVHKEPFYYYLKSAPLRLLPWTLLVGAALVGWFRRGSAYRGELAVFLRLALVAMIVVLHVSAAKTSCYVLPLLPLLLLMTGVWLEDALQPGGARKWERVLLAGTTGALVVLLLLVLFVLIAANLLHWTWGAHDYSPGMWPARYCLVMALLALSLTVVFLLRWVRFWRAGAFQQMAWHGLMMLITLLVVDVGAVLPVLGYAKSYRPVAQLVLERVGTQGRLGFASDDERDTGAFVFYLGRTIDPLPVNRRLVTYLFSGRRPAGIIVPADKLAWARKIFAGQAVDFLQTRQTGYKARAYWLIVPTR
ncbi:MAG: phospholipid carrier-dependent glycosyltransferase [Verrucomicrobia bacterium]|nr:MAG: phospholipid carrier-dependent glycosyltransferase [Verrucomicrobiota bacterium]